MGYALVSAMKKVTRRQFLSLSALALPTALGVDGRWIEPTQLRITQLHIGKGESCRFVHFTDFHHKGDASYAAEMVRTINDLKPDFVCFTGDLVEEKPFAAEALAFISQIRVPVYGSPGNHDYWSRISFPQVEQAFAATGGAWLVDCSLVLKQFDLEIVGMAVRGIHAFATAQATRRLLLMHYPGMADHLHEHTFDLILSGHSHGGQVRVPFIGALVVPHGTGPYQHGYYDTPGGPLYVNAGIGTYRLPLRINCRPEITVITM